jgi:chemotaxis protein MotA
MFFIIGLVVVFGAVLAGYTMEGGHIKVLMEPLPAEGTILLGAAIGSFLAGNSMNTIK